MHVYAGGAKAAPFSPRAMCRPQAAGVAANVMASEPAILFRGVQAQLPSTTTVLRDVLHEVRECSRALLLVEVHIQAAHV